VEKFCQIHFVTETPQPDFYVNPRLCIFIRRDLKAVILRYAKRT